MNVKVEKDLVNELRYLLNKTRESLRDKKMSAHDRGFERGQADVYEYVLEWFDAPDESKPTKTR